MGAVPWSPDLILLDYFLLGSMKSKVYSTPVTSEKDLTARVHGEFESITRQPHFGHVCEAQHRRCGLCNDVGCTQFEPRLECRLHD